MKASTRRWTRWTATAVTAISLIACQQQPQSSGAASEEKTLGVDVLPTAAVKSAVEPFEIITEQAFAAKPDELRSLIAKAQASYGRVKPTLSPQQRADAQRHLAALTNAEQRRDSSGVALASVEVYRLLLEAQNRPDDPAIRAGLLDYAGFRYDALAQVTDVSWPDMARTVRFAEAEWQRLSPFIGDTALRARFSDSLKAMSEAVARRDKSAARTAAATELQLVDLLEKQAAAGAR